MRKKVSLGRSGINAYVLKGDLKLEKSDVIVCAASPSLDLSKGRVARDLLQAAGNQVQLDCNGSYPDGLQGDEVAVVDSGNLPCQKLFFVALRPWGRGNSLQELESLLSKCLESANDTGFHSIAFPALGTGLLKYPADKVAYTTLQCIEDFSNGNSSTSLQYVNIIIYHRDHHIYSAFVREARARAVSNDNGTAHSLSLRNPMIQCRTPSYWSSQGTGSGRVVRVAVDRKTFNDVQAIVTSTWLSQFVGHGRDGVGLTNYSTIKVIKVERIENGQLFSHYARRRQVLRRKARRSHAPFEVLENIPGSGGDGIMTTDNVEDGSVLSAEICRDINETYLFHGTTMDKVGSIAEKGLRLGSDTSMFGKGVYAAESSTKADQYADPKQKRDFKGEKQMFLIRACLGRIYLAKAARKFVGMPCVDGCEDNCSCGGRNQCDSVVANGYWNFREFVVFDSSQVYPEYLITYQRI
ncbi:uncharacterized protein LOC123547196 [Mercenaria mercenaria]|uniref:uncharacterized protein LOC123547196 n=1 Tax=Mercenaria mercenaria TaxID=6596 RepID=UPI00234E6853|nr:uncharacterized protein LOC123547196 [Mercenaria mercenaria]XP_053407435.1 uncharacterized protein LOC123547196 [Mercenaria mercenaria]XP_053407436.1 uncharacterized protein LOC123547196 [Mercenaria mercenaria]